MRLSCGPFLIFACSCAAATPESSLSAKQDAQSAKADGLSQAQMCSKFGYDDDCDICSVAGWYEDGACDGFCPKPDPDCGTPTNDDTLHTRVRLDADSLRGTASVAVHDNGDGVAWFHVPSAQTVVMRQDGRAIQVSVDSTQENYIGVPLEGAMEVLNFEYDFSDTRKFQGFDSTGGFSFSWPNYCGNLFPCDNSPADGTTFDVEVSSQSSKLLIYPKEIHADAPPYMFALAIGDYDRAELGTTPSGTRVYAWIAPNEAKALAAGTKNLAAHFAFLEQTYGPYLYGDEVGSVSVAWGAGAVGGMEHHPYWHVASEAFDQPYIHAHEAAHGWFGNGVRIACWEDFVLSEGLASYLAARAVAHVDGAEAETAIWANYESQLELAISRGDTEAWLPNTCEIEIESHPLWSSIPYMKGAFFLRAVAKRASVERLDSAIASFYMAHRQSATSMAAFIEHLESELQLDLSGEVDGWLRSLGHPPL